MSLESGAPPTTTRSPLEIDPSVGETAPHGVEPADISVAIQYPGNRVEKVTEPLAASAMDVAVEPADAYERDIVLADNADRDLGREVLRKPLHDATLVYRMRGDIFRELELWPMHGVKKWAARNVVLPHVDGVIAVTDRLAATFRDRTGLTPVGSAGLVKRPSEWPTVEHTDAELRLVTLTNMTYRRKIDPLVEWAAVVDDVLAETGGRWRICGDGRHADALADGLADYDHVTYAGYADAETELADANCMIHASRLDGQPNAILEGLAAGLPVVTNPWPEFIDYGWPLDVVGDARQIRHALRRYTDPATRAERGQAGIAHLEAHHTPAAIAQQYERYFARLLTD